MKNILYPVEIIKQQNKYKTIQNNSLLGYTMDGLMAE